MKSNECSDIMTHRDSKTDRRPNFAYILIFTFISWLSLDCTSCCCNSDQILDSFWDNMRCFVVFRLRTTAFCLQIMFELNSWKDHCLLKEGKYLINLCIWVHAADHLDFLAERSLLQGAEICFFVELFLTLIKLLLCFLSFLQWQS